MSEQSKALRDAANAWTQHEWSNVLLPPPREGIIPLAYAQLMGDWLRARADSLDRPAAPAVAPSADPDYRDEWKP